MYGASEVPEDTLKHLEDKSYTTYVYTDKADSEVVQSIKNELHSVDFIVRNESEWNIRYITGIIMDPNVNVIVVHSIDEFSIMEIALASFMCKTILCVTDTVREYPVLYNMIGDLQTGCNLTINNNSFSHWYNSKRF